MTVVFVQNSRFLVQSRNGGQIAFHWYWALVHVVFQVRTLIAMVSKATAALGAGLGTGVATLAVSMFLLHERNVFGPSVHEENAHVVANIAGQVRGEHSKDGMPETYLTLWLHQVHQWFKNDHGQTDRQKLHRFLQETKDTGFKAIMTNMPWSWTERVQRGEINIDNFDKNFIELACDMGLAVHIVLSLNEMPPWLTNTDSVRAQNYSEKKSRHETCSQWPEPQSPSLAHPEIWDLITIFVRETTRKVTTKYGKCIETISPTTNHEFETKYSQTFNGMRDYSSHMLAEYETWQKERQFLPILHPFDYTCGPVCKPSPSVSSERWLEFREDFLARKYEFLCFSVHFAWNTWGTHSKEPACLLHFGEFFATTDVLNGNLFFYLARSSVVDHVVMDSNMALVGAPSSPNIVSILVSVAKAYKKKVHYEAATERVLRCNDLGQLLETGAQTDVVAMHLLQEGLKNSIKFGADSIGITNLCSPHAALPLLDSTRPAPTSGHPRLPGRAYGKRSKRGPNESHIVMAIDFDHLGFM